MDFASNAFTRKPKPGISSLARPFVAFGSVTFIEWTQFLPESERLAFVNDVLDRYKSVVADRAGEENTFKFYQMDITLLPA